jgi:hypothetical protein
MIWACCWHMLSHLGTWSCFSCCMDLILISFTWFLICSRTEEKRMKITVWKPDLWLYRRDLQTRQLRMAWKNSQILLDKPHMALGFWVLLILQWPLQFSGTRRRRGGFCAPMGWPAALDIPCPTGWLPRCHWWLGSRRRAGISDHSALSAPTYLEKANALSASRGDVCLVEKWWNLSERGRPGMIVTVGTTGGVVWRLLSCEMLN